MCHSKFWISCFLALVFLNCKQTFSQEKFPGNYFRSPLDIPLFLSGNFGEMRTNHFHTGLDIKTQGVEGKKVYAVADGYISRIKKSPWGYGNAVYVTHPNGYTSVYAHLSRFNDQIDSFYRDVQLKKQVYALDLIPGIDIIPVKKGDVIAFTGNSGSSGGPHLHFEIRHTETENPVNPMLFGFDIKDNIPPMIQAIRVYQFPIDSLGGFCNESYNVVGGYGSYRLQKNTISLDGYGLYGFAIHATDMLNGSGNICGIHVARLYFDEKLIFEQSIDSLDFYTNRYMNAHTDYGLYRDTKKSYHKSFIDENNKLNIYLRAINNGKVLVSDKKKHTVRYEILDIAGNKSEISFEVINTKDASMTKPDISDRLINCCANSEFEFDQIKMYFPTGTLYNNTPLKYTSSDGPENAFSKRHTINSTSIPVQQYYFLEIKCTVPLNLRNKALIVEEDDGSIYAHAGNYRDSWISTRVRTFGHFYVLVDTLAPVIEFLNLYQGKRLTQSKIYIQAEDDLSGVEDYSAYINGFWAPTEYDAKKKSFIVHLDEISVPHGTTDLKFRAVDERGNESVKSITFIN